MPFSFSSLFFVGTITTAWPTRFVVQSDDGSRVAEYTGSFTYSGVPGSVPFGTITGLTLTRDGATEAVFSDTNWPAFEFMTLLAGALAGEPVEPLLDLVTAEDDTAIGSPFADYFSGGLGDDTVSGKEGNDSIMGGPGRDTALGNQGDDRIDGGGGNDFLRGGQGDDTLIGGSGDDFFNGGAGADRMTGGIGRDVFYVDDDDIAIDGGGGRDTLSLERYDEGVTLTGLGHITDRYDMVIWGPQVELTDIEVVIGSDYDDCFYVYGFAERVRAAGGNDGVKGGDIDEIFSGGAGSDVLLGEKGRDILKGGLHADELFGGNGQDSLSGGRGADMLFGGRGADLLTGGLGRDTFVFKPSYDTGNEITDFEDGIDIIRISEFADNFDDLSFGETDAGTLVTAASVSFLIREIALKDLGPEDFEFAYISDGRYDYYLPGCG